MASKESVSEIMSRRVILAHKTNNFSQVIKLFSENSMHHLPIVDSDNKLCGILSSNDLMKVFTLKKAQGVPVDLEQLDKVVDLADLMTEHPFSVREEEHVSKAARIFSEKVFQSLPVVNDANEVVGIVTLKDVVEYYYELVEEHEAFQNRKNKDVN